MVSIAIQLTEEQRQLTLMALGRLVVDRPGFDDALLEIVRELKGKYLYCEFKRLGTTEHTNSRTALQALEASVKLQSHYATLLNQDDGGERMTFASAQAWLDRLAEIAKGGG